MTAPATPRGPLALTMGEPAGIGPDITLRVWHERQRSRLPPFFCLADIDVLRARARALGLDVPIEEMAPAEAVAQFDRALPVVRLDAQASAEPGRPDPGSAGAVI